MVSVIDLATTSTAVVNMGQVAVGRDEASLCAILGSCIGVTLYDPQLKIGVMAHIVLPESAGRGGLPGKFADIAIPHMAEILEKAGVSRQRIVAKIAGGASMFGKSPRVQVGQNNMAAVAGLLNQLGIPLAAQHVGGEKGRRVTLRLSDGSMLVEVVGKATVTI